MKYLLLTLSLLSLRAQTLTGHYNISGSVSRSLVTAPFDATAISGLQVWLKPETLGVNGTHIATWVDSSSSGNHMIESTTSKRPIVARDSVNGWPTAHFAGEDSLVSSNAIDLSSTKAVTMFLVCKSAAGNGQIIVEHTKDWFHSNSWVIAQNTNTFGSNVMVTADEGSFQSEFIPTRRDQHTEYAVWGSMIDHNIVPYTNKFYSQIWMTTDGFSTDGSTAIDTFHGNNTNFFPSANLYMGGRNESGFFWTGDMAEFLLYNRRLTQTEYESVNRYLMLKYNRYANIVGALVFNGDSWTAGTTSDNPWPSQCIALLTNKYHNGNYGLGTQATFNWNTNTPYPTTLNLTNLYGTNMVSSYMLSGNDFKLESLVSPTVAETNTVTQVQFLKSIGYKVIAIDVLRIDASFTGLPANFETNRVIYDTWLSNNWQTFADGYFPAAANPNLQNPADGLYYGSDKGHLSDLGNGVIASGYVSNLNTLGYH
jgi:hypothetical protein